MEPGFFMLTLIACVGGQDLINRYSSLFARQLEWLDTTLAAKQAIAHAGNAWYLYFDKNVLTKEQAETKIERTSEQPASTISRRRPQKRAAARF